jgi:hypothetical protein
LTYWFEIVFGLAGTILMLLLSHTNPQHPNGRTPRDRALLAGFHFRFPAENVATKIGIQ